jgi:hypothetical protein
MSTNAISAVKCTRVSHRPMVDVLVERLARRMLSWSERPARERRLAAGHRPATLADARAVATVHPVRWY